MSTMRASSGELPRYQAVAPRPPAAARRPRVLLAEAQPGLRRRVCRALREAGHEVTELADGAALWNELRLRNDPREPDDPYSEAAGAVDLVVCAVELPRLGGLEVLAQLRARGWSTPVVLIDGRGGAVVEGACLGAVRVLELPLELPALLATARRLLAPGGEAPA